MEVAPLQGTPVNTESGQIFSPAAAAAEADALGDMVIALHAECDAAGKKSTVWYRVRNRLLFSGFALLVISKLASA